MYKRKSDSRYTSCEIPYVSRSAVLRVHIIYIYNSYDWCKNLFGARKLVMFENPTYDGKILLLKALISLLNCYGMSFLMYFIQGVAGLSQQQAP